MASRTANQNEALAIRRCKESVLSGPSELRPEWLISHVAVPVYGWFPRTHGLELDRIASAISQSRVTQLYASSTWSEELHCVISTNAEDILEVSRNILAGRQWVLFDCECRCIVLETDVEEHYVIAGESTFVERACEGGIAASRARWMKQTTDPMYHDDTARAYFQRISDLYRVTAFNT